MYASSLIDSLCVECQNAEVSHVQSRSRGIRLTELFAWSDNYPPTDFVDGLDGFSVDLSLLRLGYSARVSLQLVSEGAGAE